MLILIMLFLPSLEKLITTFQDCHKFLNFLIKKILEHYQEFSLDRSKGAYRFKYEPKTYPGTHLQYYFIIETKNKIYGAPLNDDGELSPVNKLLIDPIEHFKQKTRLNQ